MKKFIYADNAATTKLDTDAFEAMKPFLLEDFANISQPYSFSRRAKKLYERPERLLPVVLMQNLMKFISHLAVLKVITG